MGDVGEELEEGEAGGAGEVARDVGHGEAEGEDCDVAEEGVEAGAPEDGHGEGGGGVFDFFGCMLVSIFFLHVD